MKKEFYFTILTVAILAVSASCAKQETRVDNFYGTSYELAKQSQIHNPKAGVADGPSVGLEGDIASKVMERYTKGFEKAAPKTEIYSVDVEGVTVK
jgi:hypothetical protein